MPLKRNIKKTIKRSKAPLTWFKIYWRECVFSTRSKWVGPKVAIFRQRTKVPTPQEWSYKRTKQLKIK